MSTVTVSPKYQVVIPQNVRSALGIRPGQKLEVISYAGQVRLIPVQPLQALRGLFKGIGSDPEREEDRL